MNKGRQLSFLEAIREAQEQILEKDSRAFVLGEDVGVYGGGFGATKGLIEKFPDRVLETPISEAAMTGVAMGSAILGKRPIMEIQFSDFLTVAMDPLVNQIAKIAYTSCGTMTAPVVIRAASGGGTGAGTQHSQSLEAWFAHVPGLHVVMPSNPYDAKGLLMAAVARPDPVLVLEPKSLYRTVGNVPEEPYEVDLGKVKVLQEGNDLTIIALGAMLPLVQEALEGLPYQVTLVDPVTVSPLDRHGLLEAAMKSDKTLVVTESYGDFGVAAEIMASLVELGYRGHLKRLTSLFSPIPAAKSLESQVRPSVDTIRQTIEEFYRED
ncbi:transketolase C-terminal domain-containing protein [Streptococcus sp. NLN64]|uniref:alpha-ketoacid dehydrogenase subunit beta n=1 Tax=Streptococcus sp. NLN64 TaxID=2822799 RepID=UPI0018CA5AF3|nr:transketolase C-terminal domain-containing protein [Streptococcus sp. NLN64]MBG9366979.1 alpha-ketoacid dehydrogenase subunit beta [Streptococcus sp. NLN64]